MCALWSVLFVQPVRSDSKHFQVFKPLVYQDYLSELTRGEIYKISYWDARGSNILQYCWICSAIVSVCASGKICTLIQMDSVAHVSNLQRFKFENQQSPLFVVKWYSYVHNKPIVCPFMKQNEVYLIGQNLTKSCSLFVILL